MHDLLSSYNNFFRRNRFHRSISRNLICLENDSNYYLKSNQIRLLGNKFIVKQRQSINFQFFFSKCDYKTFGFHRCEFLACGDIFDRVKKQPY